jgi:hypothetical protein
VTTTSESRVGFTRFCWICGKDVSLKTCTEDEHGNLVHEDCYSIRLKMRTQSEREKSGPKI